LERESSPQLIDKLFVGRTLVGRSPERADIPVDEGIGQLSSSQLLARPLGAERNGGLGRQPLVGSARVDSAYVPDRRGRVSARLMTHFPYKRAT
jgi:hypothetical protein